VINLPILSIFSINSVVAFFLGGVLTSSICFVYFKYLRSAFNKLKDISGISTDESDPLFTLLNNLPDCIYIKDTSGKYVIANDKFSSLLKLSDVTELLGKCDSDIYEREVALKYQREDEIILKGEQNVFKRDQKTDNKGSLKHTVTSKFPLKNKSGKIIGLVGIYSDTTDIYKANQELLDRNEVIEKERKLLRTLIDNMPDAIFIKDSNCQYLDANDTQVAIAKAKSRSDVLGKTDFDFYPKDIAEIYNADDKEILNTGNPIINKEEIGFDKEGNIRVRSTTKVPFVDDSGKIIGLVGIGRDITKLKETEEKLIEQAQSLQEVNVLLEERQEEINQQADELNEQNNILESERNLLRLLIDNIPDFIYIKDRSSKFVIANQHMLDNFKVNSVEEIIGKSDYDFFPKEMADKFFSDEQTIIKTGNAHSELERTGLDKYGNIMHTLSTKVPYRNANGEIEGIVGISKDITNLKETGIKLKEQADYLSEVNVLLEERQEEIQQQSEELSAQNSILENERNLLRTLIDNLPDSIFIKDTDSRFVIANKFLLNKLSLKSNDEIEGKPDYDLFTKERADKFYAIEKEIIRNKKPVIDLEEVKILENGDKAYRNITKVPYFDEDGRTLGLVCITKNITQLKNYQNTLEKQAEDLHKVNQLLEERSKEILKQSEWLSEQNKVVEEEKALLRTLIDNMPDIIYIKDLESRFITVNKRLLSTIHYQSLSEVVGKTDFDVSPSEEIAQEYYNDDKKIIKTGKPMINKEEIGYDEDGRQKILSTTKVPFKDADGKIAGIVGIGRDITKQKNTEKKLIEQANSLKEINVLLEERQEKIQTQSEKLNKQAESLKKINVKLEELNATKNKFFSIIAHDLKNPFQAIFGFSELLMRNFEDFEEKQRMELLTMIKTSSESAYNLLENLLQWARTQTERINYSPSNINTLDLIQQNINLSMANAEKKSIVVKPKLESTGVAWADFNMVNLIIRNLLSNAIKFTNQKGFITISSTDISEQKCLIAIKDTGIGISENNIKKLFRIDEYFSTSGTAGEDGTGLGLIICKEFIEKNHGEFMVESVLGKGTTFSFTLPRTEKALNEELLNS
jgi:PAS domain S-box-containing protein